MRQQRHAFLARHRCGIDDRPASSFHHAGNDRLGDDEDAFGIDIEIEIPVAFRELPQWRHGGNTRIVREDIDRTEGSRDGAGSVARGFVRTDIQLQRQGTSDRVGNLARGIEIDVRDSDSRAVTRQRFGYRPANAVACAGHQRHAPFESFAIHSLLTP